jgi:uncharacterized membrane protein SirB2
VQGVYSEWAVVLPSGWLIWLATSSARLAVYRLQGWHGPLRLVHLLATAVFFGGIAVLDLRLLGLLGRDIALDQLSRLILPVVHTACAMLLLSGAWLFLYDPIQTGSHTWFLPKMLSIGAALANAAVFSRPRHFGLRAIGAGALTRHARVAGLVSLVLWGTVIACATGNQEERPMVRGRGIIRPSITQFVD